MNKIHIWIGLTSKTLQEFESYFDQSKAFENSNGDKRLLSLFSLDLNEKYTYDEDMIGVFYSEHPLELKRIIEETPDSTIYGDIEKACIQKGIKEVNAIFYYTDEDITVNPNKIYNDLKYIGVFDW